MCWRGDASHVRVSQGPPRPSPAGPGYHGAMTTERSSGAGLCVAAIACLALLAACGGSSSGPAPSASAVPCSAVNSPTFTLVSPTPGSTVSTSTDTTFQMQATSPISTMIEFELVDKNGTATLGGQVFQASMSPIVYESTTPNPLPSGDTFTVYLLNTAQSGCTPVAIPGASFST